MPYTTIYMTAAMMKAVSTSNTECCLMNMVDRIMETHSIRDAVWTAGFLRSFSLRITAKSVSYTHLDVYKRQVQVRILGHVKWYAYIIKERAEDLSWKHFWGPLAYQYVWCLSLIHIFYDGLSDLWILSRLFKAKKNYQKIVDVDARIIDEDEK